MKLLLILLALSVFAGCSSTPKILMKNCEKLKSGFYECEAVERTSKIREFGGRSN
jgi:uncharacterized lipoprotein YajG